jgi:hypothetical protein
LTDALIFAGRFDEAAGTARRGLAYLAGDVSVDRVRLLDGLSQALGWAEGYEAGARGTAGSAETRIAAGGSDACGQTRWCSIDSSLSTSSDPGRPLRTGS